MSGTLRALVRDAAQALREAGVPSADADAVALAAHVLGVEQGDVRRRMVLDGRRSSDAEAAAERYAALVAERARRVPLQHLTGMAPFRSLELAVGPGVFVPRPETEIVAGLAVAAAGAVAERHGRTPIVVDLCSGSGAIAFAVRHELLPAARVLAADVSELAHAWAVRNRERLGLDVELRRCDATRAFPELDGEVDVVVSNPPYIPLGAEPLDPEVRDHDPELALYGGRADGLAIPLAVAGRAAQLLRPGGVLVMEHADVQGDALADRLAEAGVWCDVADHDDLAGRPRCVTAVRQNAGAAQGADELAR